MANIGRGEQIWSSLSTAAMLAQKTSTFPSPGKSTSTRASLAGDPWCHPRFAVSGMAVWWGEDAHERRLSADQFVLQDGRTYKTREAHERLQAICARLGNTELAERAFGENHATSIMAKEKNAWKPTPASLPPTRHSEGLCGARTRQVVELDGLRYE